MNTMQSLPPSIQLLIYYGKLFQTTLFIRCKRGRIGRIHHSYIIKVYKPSCIQAFMQAKLHQLVQTMC